MTVSVQHDRGRVVSLLREPQRIVSLVPSDTYTLLRLGAGARLVGRTRYCVEPAAEVAKIEVVGGTKNADVRRIVELAPDLVVANREENRRIDIEALEAAGLSVLLSMPVTVAAGLAHVERLAALLPSCSASSEPLLETARRQYRELGARRRPPVPTFVPIWMDPLMTVHADTFISDALELAGGWNVFSDRARRYPLTADLGRREPLPPEETVERDLRYPRITLEEVIARRPELVLLPDEPHEFGEADRAVFSALPIPASPGRVRFCDGKDLMWYGLRALEGLHRIRLIIEEAAQ